MDNRPHPRPRPMYPVPLTHENIMAVFQGAADFTPRKVASRGQTVWVYSIDGLVSGSEISDFVVKPLMEARERLEGETAV